MNKILIPSDLSEQANYAYDLAIILAEHTQAQIDILSIVPGPQGAYYGDDGMIIPDEGSDITVFEEEKNRRLETLNEWVKDKRRISSYLVKIGRIENDIIQYAEKNNVDMIVMGTEGSIGEESWAGGTHTQRITNSTSRPVLSLKCDRSDINLDKVVLVSDFHDTDPVDLSVLKEIQTAFRSKLALLYIDAGHLGKSDPKLDMADFVKRNDLSNVEYHVFKDKSVESGIGKFCAQNHIDLVALGTHQKTGFSKLFRKNISDDVVNHLYHPILTFPL